MKLKVNEENVLIKVSKLLGVTRDDLFNLINFESKWNPLARNAKTGARGLIQFMPDTAKSMGYVNADDLVKKNASIEEQLRGPVYKYLLQYVPFSGKQSLYMSVFYPKFRNVAADTAFSDKVKMYNPGIDTVQDYINYVEGKKKLKVDPQSV
jgi:hypothetical protein